MAKLTLAPEDDDDMPPVQVSGSNSSTSDPEPVNEVHRLHFDFNFQAMGFRAASPWPRIAPNANADNSQTLNKSEMKKGEER